MEDCIVDCKLSLYNRTFRDADHLPYIRVALPVTRLKGKADKPQEVASLIGGWVSSLICDVDKTWTRIIQMKC